MSEQSDLESLLANIKRLMQSGDFKGALKRLSGSLGQPVQNDEILYLSAVCERYLGNYTSALKWLSKLKQLNPDHSRSHQECGHVYRAMNDLDAALVAYSQATQLNPALIASLYAQIEILKSPSRGKSTQNMSQLVRKLEQQAEKLESTPRPLITVIDLISQNRLVKAEQLCKAFLKKNPSHGEGMRLLADIASRFGLQDDAEFLLESAVVFSPNESRVRIDFINVLRKQQKYKLALQQAADLLSLEPENPQFQSVYAVECMQSGDYNAALLMFDAILKKIPEDPVTLTSRGHALKTLGAKDDAIDSYRRALKKYPAHGEAYYSLANLKLFSFSENEIRAMESHEDSPMLSSTGRIFLDFALGKAYEDKGFFEESFFYYKRGNASKKAQSRYKASDLTTEFHGQMRVFSPALVEKHSNTGFASPDPIFIVGLPRSGSTLLEQILASHSQVDGTMELPNVLALAQTLRRGKRISNVKHYPDVLSTLSNSDFSAFGKKYIEDTQIHRGSAPFFIDKMPNNFRHIGLIHLMLPNAKIIDARRHPMGSCFSGFKQLFAEGQEFTYGLHEVGTYYKDYVELMDHWDKVLPGKVLRVQYEDVVDDLDTQVRRILDYCGLPFEQSCIDYHQTDRSVRTPSSEQVRQPIYKSGVEQWRNFEAYLDPLKQALGPVLQRYPISD